MTTTRMTPSIKKLAAAVAGAILIIPLAATAAGAAPDEPGSAEIVGGNLASTGEYPFMVSLQNMTRTSGDEVARHFCGGTLIRHNVVLTAAHCVFDTTSAGAVSQPQDIDLIIGRTRLTSTTQGEVRDAAQIFVHPRYNGNVGDGFDVALIRLSTSSGRTPLRLPTSAEASLWEPGDRVTITGWGRTSASGTKSNDLLEASVAVQSDATMANVYSPWVAAQMIGAGDTDGSPGICFGDSGGPLFFRDSTGSFVQFGVTSFTRADEPCARPGGFAQVGDGTLRAWVDMMLSRPTITISDASSPEGFFLDSSCAPRCRVSGSLRFTVRLSNPTVNDVPITFATSNGTAVAGSDYTGQTGVVTIPAGSTRTVLTVRTIIDNASENSETMFMNLNLTNGAAFVDRIGQGTILNGMQTL